MNHRLKSTINIHKSTRLNWSGQLSLSGALQAFCYFLPLLLLLVPHLAVAAEAGGSSLSFKPPAGDQSVLFLVQIR